MFVWNVLMSFSPSKDSFAWHRIIDFFFFFQHFQYVVPLSLVYKASAEKSSDNLSVDTCKQWVTFLFILLRFSFWHWLLVVWLHVLNVGHCVFSAWSSFVLLVFWSFIKSRKFQSLFLQISFLTLSFLSFWDSYNVYIDSLESVC